MMVLTLLLSNQVLDPHNNHFVVAQKGSLQGRPKKPNKNQLQKPQNNFIL
jgi:hypothetical protein